MEVVKESLLKAGALTFLLVSLGVLIGLQMDSARTGYLESELRETNLQTENFVVTQNYLEGASQNYCRVTEQQIPDLAERNARIGGDLQAFSGKSIGSDDRYRYIKSRYYVNQLKLFNMLKTYKDRCDADINLVFYFFDQSADSRRQGAVLTRYRTEVDNSTYVFSYNLETKNSTVLEVLKTDYQVEDGPTMVINGNRTIREYTPFDQLTGIMREEEN